MTISKNKNEYYFVPLGRDPGSFLDFLGLPPTASEGEAKVRENEYRDKLEVDFKSKANRLAIRMEYQTLKEKRRKNEKSEAEFASELDKLRTKYLNFNLKIRKFTEHLREKSITQSEHDAEVERLKTDFESLMTESDASLITREEMDAMVEKWKVEKSDQLEALNKLNEAYQAILSHQRDLRNRGIPFENELWRQMYTDFSQEPALFWKLALAHRPLVRSLEGESVSALSEPRQETPISIYLDFLGLPLDSTRLEVKLGEEKYRHQLNIDLKAKAYRLAAHVTYQALKDKHNKKEMSPEEFSSQVDELRVKYVTFHTKQNKLAARLKEKSITQADHDAEVEQYKSDFEAVLRETDATPISQEEADAIVMKWKKEQDERLEYLQILGKYYEKFLALQDDLRDKGSPPGSKAWREMCTKFMQFSEFAYLPSNLVRLRKLYYQTYQSFLDWADLLWERETWTNRVLWQQKLQDWIKELEQSGPAFNFAANKNKQPIHSAFPALSLPTKLNVEKLESKTNLEDVGQGPRRQQPAQKRSFSIEELMAAIAAQQAPSAKKPQPGRKVGESNPDDPLLDLLQKLAAASAQRKRKPPSGNR